MAYYEIDPWGEERADLRMGIMASVIANTNRDPKKSRPYKARDFMPNPTGIIGDPEDIGNLVAFLVSDKARYINASNYRIDGGAADSTN